MKLQRWVPVPMHLLQKTNTKGGRDEVFASAEVSSDRANNIKRSARDYARRWGWSPGSVLRFLDDVSNFIDFSTLNTSGTAEAPFYGASEYDTEQGQNKMLSNVNETETEQTLNTSGTAEAPFYGASRVVIEQWRNTDETVAEHVFIQQCPVRKLHWPDCSLNNE